MILDKVKQVFEKKPDRVVRLMKKIQALEIENKKLKEALNDFVKN